MEYSIAPNNMSHFITKYYVLHKVLSAITKFKKATEMGNYQAGCNQARKKEVKSLPCSFL